MRPIEHLETALSSYKRRRAYKHNQQYNGQTDTGWIGITTKQAIYTRPCGQHPFGQCEVLFINYRIIDNDGSEVQHMHNGVDEAEECNDDTRQLMQINMIVQWDEGTKATRA